MPAAPEPPPPMELAPLPLESAPALALSLGGETLVRDEKGVRLARDAED